LADWLSLAAALGTFAAAAVTYADAAGGQPTRAKVEIANVNPERNIWRMFEIHYFDGDAVQPRWVSRLVTPDGINYAENVW
jgi:hypothetical protein